MKTESNGQSQKNGNAQDKGKNNQGKGHANDDSTNQGENEEKCESRERQPNTRKARMERILERVSSESRAQLSFKDVAGIAGRDSMYENVDAGYETTEHKASLRMR